MSNITPQSSDVRFNEINLSTVIRSQSTSIGGTVFVSKKGRPGRFATTTSTDFNAEYGYQDAAVSFGHYCALDFFREGQNLVSVRAIGSGALYAGCLLKDNGLGVTSLVPLTAGVSNPSSIDFEALTSGAEIPLAVFTPKSGPGSYADTLAIRIRSDNIAAPTGFSASSVNTGGVLSDGTYQWSVSAISKNGETLATAPAMVIVSGPTTSASVTLTWSLVTQAIGYRVYGRTDGGMGLIATVGAGTSSFVDDGTVTPDTTKPPITSPTGLVAPTKQFYLDVYDTAVQATPLETWTCTLQDQTDSYGRQLELVQQINAFSSYINVSSNVSNLTVAVPTVYAVAKTSLAGGDSGAAPTNGQIASAWETYFSDPEQVQANILFNSGYTDVSVQQMMEQVARTRGDAMAILDCPSDQQQWQAFIDYRNLQLLLNSSYAAIYGPDIFVSDNYNGKKLYTPCSGYMAAIYARTDRIAGPQYSPAGLNRGLLNVLGIREEYNDAQRTALYNAQCNYIRKFLGGQGISAMEASTLMQSQSALSWVPVRRMLNVIKISVKQYLQYSLHEPNDDFTRKQIVNGISDYCNYWKNARGISDFEIICNSTNNPPELYNLGILKVTIFVTPILPVHEIKVDLVITKTGMSYSEISIQNLE